MTVIEYHAKLEQEAEERMSRSYTADELLAAAEKLGHTDALIEILCEAHPS